MGNREIEMKRLIEMGEGRGEELRYALLKLNERMKNVRLGVR